MDFLEKNLSNEERLAEIIAFDCGLLVGLRHLFQHVAGYQALLEEELNEVPAALEYVKRTQAVLTRGTSWLDLLGSNLTADQEYESLDIQLLLSGAVKRCQRVLSDLKNLDLCVEEDSVNIRHWSLIIRNTFLIVILLPLGDKRSTCVTNRRL